ncbi:MAG: ABC transporter substrate-binding protein [Solirubrobacterales bacterium]|nr:ABC transporter substrate-binding protein [Solirubrobacterales bacterium]
MKARKFKYLVIGVLAVMVGALSACANDENGGGGDDGPIVVGFATAQSGAFAAYDEPAVESAKLKIDQINKAGGIDGRKIEVVESDTRTDIDGARVAADEVIEKGADFMMVTCDFDYSTPSIVEAQANGIVAMSPCAGSTKFRTDIIPPNGFSMGTGIPSEAASLAEFGDQKLKAKSAYILLDPTIDYDKQSAEAFKQTWEAQGGTIAGEDTFQQDTQSVSPQISRIRELSEQPDVIYIASYPPGGVRMIRSIRSSGIDAPILADANFDGTYWLGSVPGLSDFYHSAWASLNGDDPDPQVNKMIKELTKQHGRPDTSIGSMGGYSVIEALEDAYKEAGTTKDTDLIAALETFDKKKLTIGPTTFDDTYHITLDRPVRIMEVQNGKEKFLQMWTPENVPTLDEG